jgi:hypothetical protein
LSDFAVAGIAIEPYLPQFAGASVGVSNGLLVDERCQAAPDVFGAGDVANQLHPLAGRVRSSTATTASDLPSSLGCEHYDVRLLLGGNPDNQMRARGAVATVAQLVNKKDSFTRIQHEREQELKRHRNAKRAEMAEAQAKRAQRERVKADLFALFGEPDPGRRGKALEGVLNRVFEAEEILIREAFERRDPETGRTIEQVDGAIELDGRVYLVEMKWWSEPLGRGDVSSHLVRVHHRGDVGGILISNSPYQRSAIADCKDALTTKTVVLVELREIVDVFNGDRTVRVLLTAKIHAAALYKDPLVYPFDNASGAQ